MADDTLLTEAQANTQTSGQSSEAANGGNPDQQTAQQDAKPEDKPAGEAGEAKGEKAADGENKDDKGPQVPEKYEFKAPEGLEIDKEAEGEFSALAKELKLTQEQAQKVADIGAKLVQQQAAKMAEAIENQQTEWVKLTRNDKEIGGDKLDETLATAKKAFSSDLVSPELRKMLGPVKDGGMGLGNHPEVIRFFARIGKAISDDSLVTGRSEGGNKAGETLEDRAARKLYKS